MWNVGIYRAMGERELRDIINFTRSQRLRWAAHVMRLENTRTTRKNNRMDAIQNMTSRGTQVKVDGPGRRRPKED